VALVRRVDGGQPRLVHDVNNPRLALAAANAARLRMSLTSHTLCAADTMRA